MEDEDPAALIGARIDVYEPETDVWRGAIVVDYLQQIDRLSIQLDDGSKRLISPKRHAIRVAGGTVADTAHAANVASEEEDDEEDDASPVDARSDVDVDALQRELEEQEAWLRTISASANMRSGGSSHVLGTSASRDAAPMLYVETGHEDDQTEQKADTPRGVTAAPSHEDTLPTRSASRGASLPQLRPASAEDVLPDHTTYSEGYLRSDAGAETIAGCVVRALGGGGDDSGLLSCCVLRGASLSSLVPTPPSSTTTSMRTSAAQQQLCVRVCLVNPAHALRAYLREVRDADGHVVTQDEYSHRLMVPVDVNPVKSVRTPLYRTSGVPVAENDPVWGFRAASASPGATRAHAHDVDAPADTAWEDGLCVCTLGSAPALRDTAATLPWDALAGYLLFQVMLTMPGDVSSTGTLHHTVLAQGLLRVCDVLAGAVRPFSSSASNVFRRVHGSEGASNQMEFFVRLWLPLIPTSAAARATASIGHTMSVSRTQATPAIVTGANMFAEPVRPASLFVVASLVLPRDVRVPTILLHREPSADMLSPRRDTHVVPIAAIHTTLGATSLRAPGAPITRAPSGSSAHKKPTRTALRTAPARTAGPHARSAPRVRLRVRQADSSPHAGMIRARSRSKSPRMHGTPWQAMGARDLPPDVAADDVPALMRHVHALRQNVSALETLLQHERLRVLRVRAEKAKLQRIAALLHARPSPIISSARARLSSTARVAAPAVEVGGRAGVDTLRAQLAQLQAQHAAFAGGDTSSASTVEPETQASDGEATDALRMQVARARGRVQALTERLERVQRRAAGSIMPTGPRDSVSTAHVAAGDLNVPKNTVPS